MLLSLSAFSQEEKGVSIPDPYPGLTMAQRMEKAADYMQQEKWQSAKDVYDYVLRIDEDNMTARYFRAYANERLLHYGLARADYDAILHKDPENYHALMGRSLLNQKDSRYTEALDDANLLVEQYKDSVDVWVVRAGIEKEQNLLSLAEYDYEQAYALNPVRQYILEAIELKLLQKKKKEAKRTLDALVKSGVPKNSLLYYYKKINLRNP